MSRHWALLAIAAELSLSLEYATMSVARVDILYEIDLTCNLRWLHCLFTLNESRHRSTKRLQEQTPHRPPKREKGRKKDRRSEHQKYFRATKRAIIPRPKAPTKVVVGRPLKEFLIGSRI